MTSLRSIVPLLVHVGIFAFALAPAAMAPAGDVDPKLARLMGLKERLTYEAHYGFVRLGEAVIEQYRDTTYQGQKRRTIRAVITSNPKLLFVGYKEERFHSIIAHNDTTVYDLYYWKDDVDDREFGVEHYRFDYDAGHVLTWKFNGEPDTLEVDGPAVCGPAVLYRTRMLAGTGKSTKVPIYINKKRHYVVMSDHRRSERVENTTFGNTTEEAWFVDGDAAFDGPFGFSGKFRGWLKKTGHGNVPLEGHMKVWIGSIKVKLVKYEVF